VDLKIKINEQETLIRGLTEDSQLKEKESAERFDKITQLECQIQYDKEEILKKQQLNESLYAKV